LLYETSRKLAEQSYNHWISNELFSFGWFFTIGVIAIVYIVWLSLVDKSNLCHLLLLGSLAAICFFVADMVFMGFFGVAEYKIRPFPLMPPIFIISITKAPIAIMLIHQYTSSWKGYILWTSIIMAFLAFLLFPLYSIIGIYRLHNWNYFYQFLLLLFGGLMSRVAFLWFIGIEQRNTTSK